MALGETRHRDEPLLLELPRPGTTSASPCSSVGIDRLRVAQPHQPDRDGAGSCRQLAERDVSPDPAPGAATEQTVPSTPDRPSAPDPTPTATDISTSWMPWIFAAKTTASALLALLVAFSLDLDQPKWALLTVFIVAQPQSGLVLAKSFYRIIGTMVGAAGALFLVSAFAQERVLFLGALAVWLGVCTYASKRAQGFAGYGFVLAGYTVAIVGIPGALNPQTAFYIASARVTEVVLGIAITAAISHLVLPVSLGLQLRRAVGVARESLAALSHAVLSGKRTAGSELGLLRQAIAIEELRRSAVFEDREIRAHSAALRELLIRFTAVVHIAQTLDRPLLEARPSLMPAFASAIRVATDAIAGWRARPIATAEFALRLNQARAQLPPVLALCREASGSSEDLLRQAVAVSKVRELLAALTTFTAAWQSFSTGQPPARKIPSSSRSNDDAAALWAGVRAMLTFAAASVFWLTTAWPSGSTAAILAGVVAARGATMERSGFAAAAMAIVVAVASLPLFILIEVLLPDADGFVMFAIAVAPVLFACAYLMADRRTMVIGFMSALYLASVGAFQNQMVYDAAGFVNTSLATFVAIAAAAVMFIVVAPETPAAARRRFTRTSRRLLRRIAGQDPIGLVEFDVAMTDALEQLLRHLRPERSEDLDSFDAAIALAALGRDLIGMRERSSASSQAVVVDVIGGRDHGQAARAAAESAAACLAALADETLPPVRARALARDMVSFVMVCDELDRAKHLLRPAQPAREVGHAA